MRVRVVVSVNAIGPSCSMTCVSIALPTFMGMSFESRPLPSISRSARVASARSSSSSRDRSPATTHRYWRAPGFMWNSACGVICVAWMSASGGKSVATFSTMYDLPDDEEPRMIPASGRDSRRDTPIR